MILDLDVDTVQRFNSTVRRAAFTVTESVALGCAGRTVGSHRRLDQIEHQNLLREFAAPQLSAHCPLRERAVPTSGIRSSALSDRHRLQERSPAMRGTPPSAAEAAKVLTLDVNTVQRLDTTHCAAVADAERRAGVLRINEVNH